jgi:hypothetical protein
MSSSDYAVLSLETTEEWEKLHSVVDLQKNNQAVTAILGQLQVSGARSVLIENSYFDRDYSEEFSAFYARIFRQYRRQTRRLHFFVLPAGDILQHKDSVAISAILESASASGQYLGFVIVRPVRSAPIGRAVIDVHRGLPHVEAYLEVRARYEVHVLGSVLSVRGMPFTQQDTRISACAQASIWMSGRHFHTRHRGPWLSTVDISRAASQPTDMTLASSLPAGAGGLNVNNMVRALRAMDRHPYVYAASIDKAGNLVWPSAMQPQAVLNRYVGSGIPVILGLILGSEPARRPCSGGSRHHVCSALDGYRWRRAPECG